MVIRKADYQDYDYRDFWKEEKRVYEDRAERIALRKLLLGVKKSNKLFIDIGCGYGRLFNEYKDFDNIILIDYSIKNLKNAKENINKFLKFNKQKLSSVYFIVSDASSLPIKSKCADVILTVRVIHHLERPEQYFNEVSRIIRLKGLYLLEFANKRNLKNILRYFAGKMDTSPFNLVPSQVGETILNYHPKYIKSFLYKRGFSIKKSVSVSNFRLEFFKRHLRLTTILFFENIYQNFFSFTFFGPSIFLKCVLEEDKDYEGKFKINESQALKSSINDSKISIDNILICPMCRKDKLFFREKEIICNVCGKEYKIKDGIYIFNR